MPKFILKRVPEKNRFGTWNLVVRNIESWLEKNVCIVMPLTKKTITIGKLHKVSIVSTEEDWSDDMSKILPWRVYSHKYITGNVDRQ